MSRLQRRLPCSSASRGWGLVETLLTLGAISALSAGIYIALSPASATAQTKIEQDNLRDLSGAIEQSFGLVGGYAQLTTERAVQDRLAPDRMRQGNVLLTNWGSAVGLRPVSIKAPNDAFAVDYPSTPEAVCAKLAAAVARNVYDLRINGQSMFTNGQLDIAGTAAQCAQGGGAEMEFIYHSGLAAGSAVATPVSLPPAPPSTTPPPSTPVDINPPPPGTVGPANPGTPVVVAPPVSTPPPPSGPPMGPPATPTPTPTPPGTPVGDPPPLTRCSPPPSWTTTQTMSPNCPAGEYGINSQQRVGTYSYACPEAWDAPVQSLSWGGWTTTSNTCTACPAPSVENETRWEARTAACPSGQTGSQTWEAEQARSRTQTYDCPAGTTVLPSPTASAWSGWADTGVTRNASNTCVSTYASRIRLSCTKSYRNGDPPAGRRILGLFEAGSDNPSAYSVVWSGIPVGDPLHPSLNTSAKPWTNPAPNSLSVDAQCSGNAEWGYRARATNLVSGQVYQSDFTCMCTNLGN